MFESWIFELFSEFFASSIASLTFPYSASNSAFKISWAVGFVWFDEFVLKALLTDAYSGIKYFGIVPYGSGTVNYPTSYDNTETDNATELNKWFKAELIPANSTTGKPESGKESIEVIVDIPENGRYFVMKSCGIIMVWR